LSISIYIDLLLFWINFCFLGSFFIFKHF
jgi:hypothetical protein